MRRENDSNSLSKIMLIAKNKKKQADVGCVIYNKLKSCNQKNTAFILLPSNNNTINYIALYYIKQLCKEAEYNNAVIITKNTVIKDAIPYFDLNPLSDKTEAA